MPTVVIEVDVDTIVSEGVVGTFISAMRDVALNAFGASHAGHGPTVVVTATWKNPKDPRILRPEVQV